MSDTQFDYYYGSEGDQFSFIRIPKLMLLDPKFQALSLKSIILYGFLLDRMNLSMRRGWLDEDNRVYIRFRIKEIMEDMNVCEKTAIGYLAELEKIGLVEKDKKGMGMGNKLYVKNFISPDLRSKAFITSKKYSNGEDESMSKNRNSTENVDNFKNSEVCKASKINITVENGGNETVDFYGDEAVENDGYDAVSFSGDDTVKSYSQSNTEYINNKYINNKGSDNESNPINRHIDGFLGIYKYKAKRTVDEDSIDMMDPSNIYREGLGKMFYIPIQKDFSKVKNKVALGLTKRQLICFLCAAILGIPCYLLLKGVIGTDVAAVIMILIMLPFFLFALYEKDGQPLEVVLKNYITENYIRPHIRPVRNEPVIESCMTIADYIEELERQAKKAEEKSFKSRVKKLRKKGENPKIEEEK